MLVRKLIKRDEHGFMPYGLGAMCNLQHEKGWCCTRDKGHSGAHAAHTSPDAQLATWPKEKDE